MKLLKFENEIAVNKTNKIVTMVRIYQSRPNLEDWSIFFPLSSLKTKPYLWPTGLSSLCSPKLFSESKRWREPKRCCWSSLGSIHWTSLDCLCCFSFITGFHPRYDNLLTLGPTHSRRSWPPSKTLVPSNEGLPRRSWSLWYGKRPLRPPSHRLTFL